MNLPIPDFVPVPAPETMHLISIVLLMAGICITAIGMLYLFRNKRKGEKNTPAWLCVWIGVLLIANHGVQLIF